TSTPGSRKARETTLTPRSCPSNPSFSVRTRIFFCDAGSVRGAGLEDGRLAVDTEHLLERGHDLALGDVGLHAVDQDRHQVVLPARRRLQLGQPVAHARPIPALAQRPPLLRLGSFL